VCWRGKEKRKKSGDKWPSPEEGSHVAYDEDVVRAKKKKKQGREEKEKRRKFACPNVGGEGEKAYSSEKKKGERSSICILLSPPLEKRGKKGKKCLSWKSTPREERKRKESRDRAFLPYSTIYSPEGEKRSEEEGKKSPLYWRSSTLKAKKKEKKRGGKKENHHFSLLLIPEGEGKGRRKRKRKGEGVFSISSNCGKGRMRGTSRWDRAKREP